MPVYLWVESSEVWFKCWLLVKCNQTTSISIMLIKRQRYSVKSAVRSDLSAIKSVTRDSADCKNSKNI